MEGLKTCRRFRAILARRRRRINSSLLPENMGPQMTSIQPTLPVIISIDPILTGNAHYANLGRAEFGAGIGDEVKVAAGDYAVRWLAEPIPVGLESPPTHDA